jgi:hypothetical protein
MKTSEFTRLEGIAFSMNKPNVLNEWFKLLVESDNSVVMQVTEKAKFNTLFHLCMTYKLTDDQNAPKTKLLSLVRKEVNKQKKRLYLESK